MRGHFTCRKPWQLSFTQRLLYQVSHSACLYQLSRSPLLLSSLPSLSYTLPTLLNPIVIYLSYFPSTFLLTHSRLLTPCSLSPPLHQKTHKPWTVLKFSVSWAVILHFDVLLLGVCDASAAVDIAVEPSISVAASWAASVLDPLLRAHCFGSSVVYEGGGVDVDHVSFSFVVCVWRYICL